MTERFASFKRWFRLIYVFNAWASSIVVGLVVCLGYAAVTTVQSVPTWLWVLIVADGTAFALYFLLSGPVGDYLAARDRTLGPVSRLARTLERWDEYGRDYPTTE